MKKIVLINWDTMSIEEHGVLAEDTPESTFANLNDILKALMINKVWLIEPENVVPEYTL